MLGELFVQVCNVVYNIGRIRAHGRALWNCTCEIVILLGLDEHFTDHMDAGPEL